MGELSPLNLRVERTRRNIVKAAPILASAVALSLVRTKNAYAGGGNNNDQGQNNNNQGDRGRSHCLLRGTKVQTADGERKVEDVAIGDMLPTMLGGMRPVQWIARYSLKKSDPSKSWVKDALPIRIARSALAPNVPHTDLYVTPEHALLIDGLLTPARNLINGATITRYEPDDCNELEFFHIKLESHDVIYAEGAPVETLLNVDETVANFADYFRRYGTPEVEEMPCLPVVSYGGRRGEFKSRIRSAISPWLDRRQRLDVIRDRLEERGIELMRRQELLGA
jgi:Hint domain